MSKTYFADKPMAIDIAAVIFKTMLEAMKVRADNFETNPHPLALADKMAGELGQAMFGLNTWGDDDLAAITREVHDLVMDFAVPYIRNLNNQEGAL